MGKRGTDKTGSSSPSLGELNRKIDRVNRELVKLLGEHAQLSEKIGRLRQAAGERPFDLATEQQWLQQLGEAHQGPLTAPCLRAVFRELLSGARALVKPLRVSYLGPVYSYSHLAAIERFGSSAELIPVATISAVFEELDRQQVDYGIVPLENSTDGRVADTLGMFARLPARICGEVQLRIHHHLLGRGQRGDIREDQ